MKNTFLLSLPTIDIGYAQLVELHKEYWKVLKANPFPKPPDSGDMIKMLHYLKRRKKDSSHQIGPYINITVFEAANRIASDLVILKGIRQLFEDGFEPENQRITVRFGNKHEKGKGDFTIGDFEGEAFNVASSFYKVKLRTTNTKWKKIGVDRLKYILVNNDAFEDVKMKDAKVIEVKQWDKPFEKTYPNT